MAHVTGSVGFKTGIEDQDLGPLSKTELRRIARKQREEAWEAYNTMKPNDDEDNPQDVEAIREAQRTMGDFKLKTDPDYVAPEVKADQLCMAFAAAENRTGAELFVPIKEERMTPDKKRVQMIKLDMDLFALRMKFNKRFLALREDKSNACCAIAELNKRLRTINETMGIEGENPYLPTQQVYCLSSTY